MKLERARISTLFFCLHKSASPWRPQLAALHAALGTKVQAPRPTAEAERSPIRIPDTVAAVCNLLPRPCHHAYGNPAHRARCCSQRACTRARGRKAPAAACSSCHVLISRIVGPMPRAHAAPSAPRPPSPLGPTSQHARPTLVRCTLARVGRLAPSRPSTFLLHQPAGPAAFGARPRRTRALTRLPRVLRGCAGAPPPAARPNRASARATAPAAPSS